MALVENGPDINIFRRIEIWNICVSVIEKRMKDNAKVTSVTRSMEKLYGGIIKGRIAGGSGDIEAIWFTWRKVFHG